MPKELISKELLKNQWVLKLKFYLIEKMKLSNNMLLLTLMVHYKVSKKLIDKLFKKLRVINLTNKILLNKTKEII